MRILLIEDVVQIAELINRGLDAEGWNVVHAGSRDDAYEMLGNQDFDVIVLDLSLPSYDWQEACQEVQNVYRKIREQVNATPVLVLSTFGDVDELKENMRPSDDGFMAKPFDFEEFISQLKSLNLRNRR